MQVQKTATLTRAEIVSIYWLEFLQEVKDNVTNIPAAGETWHLEPTEINFWKWFIKEKIDSVATTDAAVDTSGGEENGEVAQDEKSGPTVES